MRKENRASVYIIIAAVLWGCIGVFFRLLTAAGLSSVQATAVRICTAALIFTAYMLIRSPEKLKIRLRDIWYFIGSGILSLMFFFWCYFNAIERSGMAVAAVLLYTSPIFVTLMSAALFGERLTKRKVSALGLAFAGCVLVTGFLGGGERASAQAVLFGVGSGFGYALYSIFGKIALKKYDAMTVTAYTFIFAAAGILPLALAEGGAIVFSAKLAAGAIGVAVPCCIIPYALYTKGLDGMEAGKAAIIATAEPVTAAAIGILAYGEPAGPQTLAGIALVLAAIAILNGRKAGK